MTQPGIELPPIDVETYAETLARLQHHPPALAPRILEGIGLTDAQWVSLKTRWATLIEADLPRGGSLVTAFSTRFADTRRRLLEHGESLPDTPRPPPAIVVPEPPPGMPTAMRAHMGTHGVAPVPGAASGDADPWAGVPAAMRAFASIQGTQMAPDVPAEPALPFVAPSAAPADWKALPAPPDPWAGVPAAMRAFTSIQGTQMAPDVPAEPALPFAPAPTEGAERKAPPGPAGAPDPWAGVPAAMRAFTSIQGTQMAPDVPIEPALPFAPAPTESAERKAPPGPAGAPDPWAGLPPAMRAFTSIRGTELASPVPAEPALPFAPATSPARERLPHGLSLEQAASLHVELALPWSGVSQADILRRYSLDELQHEELTRYWSGRTAADASLRERWEAACTAYRAWLARERLQPR